MIGHGLISFAGQLMIDRAYPGFATCQPGSA